MSTATMTQFTTPHRLDVEAIRADFPILERRVHGKPLVYLDNAATSQKPRQVIEAMTHYYEHTNANVHRGVHTLSEEATAPTRARAQAGALHRRLLPEGDHLHAQRHRGDQPGGVQLGPRQPQAGRRVLLTEMEHHSNLVPWQILAAEQRRRARLRARGRRRHADPGRPAQAADAAHEARSRSPHMSNVLGTINPVEEMAAGRARGGRAGAGGRRAERAAHAGRRAGRWTSTSWRSPATRCSGRPASACCGAGASCSKPCRRSWAAAT